MLRVTTLKKHLENVKMPRRSQTMTIVSLMAAVLVTGCASASRSNFTVGAVPDDYRLRHPIVVSENAVNEDIPVSANMRELSFRDYNVVNDFANRFRRSGGRTMQVMVPSQSFNEAAARRISRQVIKVLREKGIARSQIITTSYATDGQRTSAPVRMSFLALVADAGECGKWEENIIADENNRQYQNFGCATQNNLAKMIANPADLIGPRGESPIDASRRDTVITNWRSGGSAPLARQF
ncbi:MAG: CpaD family pilus assembly protein [Rhizobiaceae bacterium]|nr:CpaD family pilus assembly protein [Rhizobiaceae bacterium]